LHTQQETHRKRKGRFLNKWNSKKRKLIRQFFLEGPPSGSAGRPRSLATCGDQEDQASLIKRIRKRNTKRGLRSKNEIAERSAKRSFKRRKARQRHKTLGSANIQVNTSNFSASAQEPIVTTTTYKLGKKLRITTLNIRGTNKLGVREEIVHWMNDNRIDILLLQETKSSQNKREIRKEHTWYFSGNDKDKCHHGVGIVIRSDLNKHIIDIEPINERLMYITLDSTMPISIINTYMPTSVEDVENKEKAYENL